MSIHRWIDKEGVVHNYNEVLLSHKKEQIWVTCIEANEPRACYTDWSKLEENKYILTHMYGIQKNGTDEPLCRAATET